LPVRHLPRTEAVAAAKAGLAEQDAWAGLTLYIEGCVALRSGALAPRAGTIETTPEMWKVARHGRRVVTRLVTRAQKSEALRPDVTALDIA
jgi:hypothetical protein